ncbi:extracellular solute-binding protein [Desulfovibrio inopinatus]|uniref:extracellular solute-binding protein n=1 Tax=Desulfovibrio inopinatus TaxID=102109 RepID=UPI0009FF1933|nr:extracellular solute-binding protein [Desulfovibrio inopinatus]
MHHVRLMVTLVVVGLLACAGLPASAQTTGSHTSHALALGGTPKYPADFTHFDYVNPNAPKGGTAKLSSVGTFDTFNPYLPKGLPPSGIGLIYDSLTVKSDDEPFTEYGLVAKSIELADDHSWVAFHIDPAARFSDGEPITADDVVFTFNTLLEKGGPQYAKYYHDVKGVTTEGNETVRFTFKNTNNPELPLILGQLPVLPKHYWETRDFTETGFELPIGSGPYTIAHFQPGHTITYKRDPNYWAKDHPVNKGRYNFDEVVIDYYRDETVTLQAFKAGEYDFRQEYVSKNWATSYTGPAFDKGLIVKKEIPHNVPQGMQAFFFNTRRDIFKDKKVRQALGLAFDFEWTNANLFYGLYKRATSFFSNSELASSGLPSPEELAILEPYRGKIPDEVFTAVYAPPSTAGKGGIRANLRKALTLLREAGYVVENGVLVNATTKKPFTFEFLLSQKSMERVVLPFVQNLEKLGIKPTLRVVDQAQYYNRMRDYDYDMIVIPLPQSLSPGNEQRYYWTSSAADTPGAYNFAGIKDPVIDELVEKIIIAKDRKTLVTLTHALDRVLLAGHYVIPQWYSGVYRVAWWDKFDRPKVHPLYDLGFYTWWIDPAKEAALKGKKSTLSKE